MMSGPARALGIEIPSSSGNPAKDVSGPARALGIEITHENLQYPLPKSGPARALGIEIQQRHHGATLQLVRACEGPGD